MLRILAESYADIQQQRIRSRNRMERGGVDPGYFAAELDALDGLENGARLSMLRAYRKLVRSELPAVDAWQKAEFGIGEHLLARLLGHMGHPRIANPCHWEGDGADRILVADATFERRVSDLWSYCGHGDATRKRRKGMTAEDAFALGNPKVKMLVHLLAEASMKCKPTIGCTSPKSESSACAPSDLAQPTNDAQRITGEVLSDPSQRKTEAQLVNAGVSSSDEPPQESDPSTATARRTYRAVYDQRRVVNASRDWTDGHKHNDALRIVGKHILRDLWIASA